MQPKDQVNPQDRERTASAGVECDRGRGMKPAQLKPTWDMPIIAFRWDARAERTLLAHFYNRGTKRSREDATIRVIAKTDPNELLRVDGCGRKTIAYIAATVCAYDPHPPYWWKLIN